MVKEWEEEKQNWKRGQGWAGGEGEEDEGGKRSIFCSKK